MKFSKASPSEVVEALRAAQGSNAKLVILRQAVAETPYFKEFLKATLDPLVRYNIRKIPKYEIKDEMGTTNIQSILKHNKLEPLSSRKKTGGEAVKYLENLLTSMSTADAKSLEIIINRDLDCGVSLGLIDKVCPDLIKEFPVQLCTPYSKARLDAFVMPAASEIKADGLRGNLIVKEDGTVDTRSRNGKELGLDDLFQFVGAKYRSGGFVLDGEVLVRDPVNPKKFLPRKTGNGIINKCAKGTATEAEKAQVVFVVFDYIPLVNFQDCSLCKIPNHERFETLRNIVMNLQNPMIQLIERRTVKTKEEALEHFNECVDRGLEGTILKDPNSPWAPGRPDYQLKFKLEQECDLEILSVYEGNGRLVGSAGGVVCATSDRKLTVSIGGGWSDSEREWLWKNRESICENGSIVEVLFNEKIQNSDGSWSLFLPRKSKKYSGILRTDKNVANSFEEVP